ncbi:MAG: hypothetical protein ACOX3G_10705 [Armatimonadota bacterium]|jgi:hypothetical protein
MRRLLVMMFVMAAVVVLCSGAFAAWEPCEMRATPTQQVAILTPSWSLDSGVYTYSYELYNTTKNEIDGFMIHLPDYIDTSKLWGFAQTGDWHFTVRPGNFLDWQNYPFVEGLLVGDRMTFSFKSYYMPDNADDLWANCEAGFLFGNATYGPGPNEIPEPATCLMLVSGLVCLIGVKRRFS